MRRFLRVALVAVALGAVVSPVSAQSDSDSESIIDRPPMDLGADQIGTLRQFGRDLLYPERVVKNWFDVGAAYPVGNLEERNIDPGLLVRFNQRFWGDGAFNMFGSIGALFGNDSYFNDQQNAIAAAAPISNDPLNPYSGVDIQSRYFYMVPATVNLSFDLPIAETVAPFVALGPGVVWTHESVVTSAVNNGVGTTELGFGNDDPLIIGPGGEQGISPYAIRTQSKFNLGWDARAGIGFAFDTDADRPLWVRGVISASTYYTHTAPSTNVGFALSFGR